MNFVDIPLAVILARRLNTLTQNLENELRTNPEDAGGWIAEYRKEIILLTNELISMGVRF